MFPFNSFEVEISVFNSHISTPYNFMKISRHCRYVFPQYCGIHGVAKCALTAIGMLQIQQIKLSNGYLCKLQALYLLPIWNQPKIPKSFASWITINHTTNSTDLIFLRPTGEHLPRDFFFFFGQNLPRDLSGTIIYIRIVHNIDHYISCTY